MSGSGAIWSMYDQTISPSQTISYPYLLCWAAKWLDKKTIYSDALINYPKAFEPIRKIKKAKLPMDLCLAVSLDDKQVCQSLWDKMNEADICLAHNGDDFDVKMMNLFFLKNGMKPPTPFRTIDTKKTSRRSFRFMSNRLDSIARQLSIGHKMSHIGYNMWRGCAQGDKKCWAMMTKYNRKDVTLLQEVYEITRPFIANHPNMGVYEHDKEERCRECAGMNLRKDGKNYDYTNKRVYQLWECKDCGRYTRGKALKLVA